MHVRVNAIHIIARPHMHMYVCTRCIPYKIRPPGRGLTGAGAGIGGGFGAGAGLGLGAGAAPHVGVHTIAETGDLGSDVYEALESRKQCCESQRGLVGVRTRFLKGIPTRTHAPLSERTHP